MAAAGLRSDSVAIRSSISVNPFHRTNVSEEGMVYLRDVYQKAKSSCPEVLKLGILVEGERERRREKGEKRRRMKRKFEDGRMDGGCESKRRMEGEE